MVRSGFCILLQGLIVQCCDFMGVECHVVDPKYKGLLFIKRDKERARQSKKEKYAKVKSSSKDYIKIVNNKYFKQISSRYRKLDDLCDTVCQFIAFDFIVN
jgi:hypothetical protein